MKTKGKRDAKQEGNVLNVFDNCGPEICYSKLVFHLYVFISQSCTDLSLSRNKRALADVEVVLFFFRLNVGFQMVFIGVTDF